MSGSDIAKALAFALLKLPGNELVISQYELVDMDLDNYRIFAFPDDANRTLRVRLEEIAKPITVQGGLRDRTASRD